MCLYWLFSFETTLRAECLQRLNEGRHESCTMLCKEDFDEVKWRKEDTMPSFCFTILSHAV